MVISDESIRYKQTMLIITLILFHRLDEGNVEDPKGDIDTQLDGFQFHWRHR